jgi:hypothetical protein
MIIIKNIINSGGACPYQLEAETGDGKWMYLRYRGGWLRYVVAETSTTWMKSKKDSWYDFSQQIGDDLDGYPDHDKFMEVLKDKIQFPEGFKFEYEGT